MAILRERVWSEDGPYCDAFKQRVLWVIAINDHASCYLKTPESTWSKNTQISRFLSKPFWPIFIRNSDHASAKPNFCPNFRLGLQKPLSFHLIQVSRTAGLLYVYKHRRDSSLQQQKVSNLSKIRASFLVCLGSIPAPSQPWALIFTRTFLRPMSPDPIFIRFLDVAFCLKKPNFFQAALRDLMKKSQFLSEHVMR
jgi:hypothetical protein